MLSCDGKGDSLPPALAGSCDGCVEVLPVEDDAPLELSEPLGFSVGSVAVLPLDPLGELDELLLDELGDSCGGKGDWLPLDPLDCSGGNGDCCPPPPELDELGELGELEPPLEGDCGPDDPLVVCDDVVRQPVSTVAARTVNSSLMFGRLVILTSSRRRQPP